MEQLAQLVLDPMRIAPIAGLLLVLVAMGVFVAKREFQNGGVAVCALALLMIGMPRWKSVEMKGPGLEIRAIADTVRLTASATLEAIEEAQKAAALAEATRVQLLALIQQIRASGTLPATPVRGIVQQLETIPKTDQRRLSDARTRLSRIVSPGTRP